MLVLENILLALGSLRANKMRALLTILGIIIGIASVIAIMSVGNSIRSSVTSSMESMGANHITVGLRQKEPEEEVTEEGYRFEGEMQQASMTEEDYLTNEMLEDAEKEFADKIDGVLLSENVGEGQAKDGKLSSNVTLMGVNTAFLKNQDLKLLSGRLLTERDQKEKKGVVVVSDRVVRKLFDGDTKKAAGSDFIDAMQPLDDTPRGYNKVCFLEKEGLPWEAVEKEFDGEFTIIRCTVPSFGDNSGELTVPNSNKSYAIETLINYLGIPRENTYAFGDGMNDAEMLQYVAHGIAMGNAKEGLKAIADEVTASQTEDGIAISMKKHGLC